MSSRYRCIKDYHTPYPDPIPFSRHELVQVGETFADDPAWSGWYRCTGEVGQVAWIHEDLLNQEGDQARMRKDYDARELTLIVGEIVEIRETLGGFGLAKKTTGLTGWVPMGHLEAMD